MKRRGKHPEKALSAVAVRNATPGRHADGNGLFLVVDQSGARRWVQRLTIGGKRHDLGLGSAALVPLAQARAKAAENRSLARSGGNPLALKRQSREILTFEQAARRVHELHKPNWTNKKQAAQWIGSLETYAFPHIGHLRVDLVQSGDVLRVLSPIWTSRHETARRVRQRINTTLAWCIGQGWITANPAQGIQAALPKPQGNVQHHAAIPYSGVRAALALIHESGAGLATKLAIEFVVLTAARSGEVRNATWAEIDFDAAVWTVPAERMKKRKIHKVPLSPRCIEILREAETMKDGHGLIFPGTKTGKPLSDMTLSKLLREQAIACVPHGFRSSFRQWAAEETNLPREVAEFALAHVVGDDSERAYQRSDLFEKRRKLMEAWASYLQLKQRNVVSLLEVKQRERER